MPKLSKTLEIRDDGIHIPCLATLLFAGSEDAEPGDYPIRRAGLELPTIVLTDLALLRSKADPSGWGKDLAMRSAHQWILAHWSMLEDGDVVDAEFARGERAEPRQSERYLAPVAAGQWGHDA